MKQSNQVNDPLPTELTYEQLKKYKGFENVTEAQAEKEIENIKRLTKVLYYLYVYEQQMNSKDNETTEP